MVDQRLDLRPLYTRAYFNDLLRQIRVRHFTFAMYFLQKCSVAELQQVYSFWVHFLSEDWREKEPSD
jgi:hypothetical protein